jgi:hypothetical protein
MRFGEVKHITGSLLLYGAGRGLGSGVLGVRGDGLSFGNSKGGFDNIPVHSDPQGYGCGSGMGMWHNSHHGKGFEYLGNFHSDTHLVVPNEVFMEVMHH